MIVEILRGLPGSGKSRYTKERDCAVFSADRFFERGGNYFFEPSRIGDAHLDCFAKYLNHMRECANGDGLVCVDNTNIHASEISPYVMVAAVFGVDVKVITFMCDPFTAYKRQVHGVPGNVFMSMYQDLLSERLPPYWKHTIRFVEGYV